MNRRTLIQAAALAAAASPALAQQGLKPATSPFAADFAIAPHRTAFINVDLQNCFIESGPAAAPAGRALLDKLNGFANLCRQRKTLVIHTAHILRPDLSNAGVMPKYIAAIREGMISRGSTSAALHRDLVVAPDDLVLEKPRFGAFQGTDLEMILHTRGIDSVIIGGIATNICCETTAREASARDFQMLFLSDGTTTSPSATVSADEFQKATCESLRAFGEVLTLAQASAKLSRS